MKNPNLPKYPKPPKISSPSFAKASAGRPGYEYLTCYKLGLAIQELTDEFCQKFMTPNDPKLPNPNFRQIQQMTQAARSNPQNIAEGYTQESLKGYIYLSGISRGSNEELGKDFLRFLKKEKLTIWPKDKPKVRGFRSFRVKWLSQNTLNTPTLPNDPEESANLILTLCQMEGYLLNKLIDSLKQKHKKEGGLTEKLYSDRKKFRGY